MLSQQDLNMMESMMVRVVGAAVAANNAELKAYIDERIEQVKTELKEYIDERIEQAKVELKKYIDERIEQVKTELKEYMDERIEQAKVELKEYMDERIGQAKAELKEFAREHVKEVVHESESFLLDEIDRFYNFGKRDIQKLTARVEEIVEYYRIRKSEESRFDYVIHLYHKQQQEINEIRQVLAM